MAVIRSRALFWWWAIPVLLLAAWLGARSLNERPVWSDEINSIRTIRDEAGQARSLAAIWTLKAEQDPWQAPGYYLALALWGRAVGWNQAALRALSLCFGLLALAMTYRLGADWLSPRVGLFAALALASSAFYVHYLVEMRVYALIAFASVSAVWAYLSLASSTRPKRGLWLLLFLSVVAALYSHYLAAVPLVGVALYHLLFVPKQRRWWQIVAVIALAAAAYLPWVPAMLSGLGKAADSDGLHETALSLTGVVKGFLTTFGNGSLVFSAALLLLAGLAVIRGHDRWTRHVRGLCLIAGAALIVILGVNHALQIIQGGRLRYLMPLWPLFAVIVALGIVQLRRWPALMAALLALWVGFGLWATLFTDFTVNLDGGNVTFPLQRVASALDGHTQPHDLVVSSLADDEPWTSFYGKTEQFYFAPDQVDYTMVYADDSGSPQGEMALPVILTHERVWVAYRRDAPSRSLAALQADLAPTFQRCPGPPDRLLTIDLYVSSDSACPAS